MKKKLIGLTATAAFLGAFGASVNAGEMTVDTFETDQAFIVDTTPGNGGLSSTASSGGGDILGGERNLGVDLLTSPAGTFASIGVANGLLSFSTGSLATGSGTVQWDGVDGSIALDPDGLGGVDLSGMVSFSIVTIFSDFGFEFVINAYTDATHWTSISFAATCVNDADASCESSPYTNTIPLAAFDNPAFCGAVNPAPGVNSITCSDAAGDPGGFQTVDWSNLGALELIIDPSGGTTAVDLTLDSIKAVPAPSTLALLGLGLLAAGMRYRRRESEVS